MLALRISTFHSLSEEASGVYALERQRHKPRKIEKLGPQEMGEELFQRDRRAGGLTWSRRIEIPGREGLGKKGEYIE